jgi:hypothetical protein
LGGGGAGGGKKVKLSNVGIDFLDDGVGSGGGGVPSVFLDVVVVFELVCF